MGTQTTERDRSARKAVGFRLGLYDPDPGSPLFERLIGRVYADTPREHRIMQVAMQTYNKLAAKNKSISLCIGVFPIEG